MNLILIPICKLVKGSPIKLIMPIKIINTQTHSLFKWAALQKNLHIIKRSHELSSSEDHLWSKLWIVQNDSIIRILIKPHQKNLFNKLDLNFSANNSGLIYKLFLFCFDRILFLFSLNIFMSHIYDRNSNASKSLQILSKGCEFKIN
jgi:hypothetical protein